VGSEEGGGGACAQEAAPAAAPSVARGRRSWAGAHAAVRGGRWLGLGEGGIPRKEEGEWAGGRSHGPGGKRKEVGPKSLLGLESKEVKENHF
jgi:hypothetical protein